VPTDRHSFVVCQYVISVAWLILVVDDAIRCLGHVCAVWTRVDVVVAEVFEA